MSYTFLPYDPNARFFDKRRIHPFTTAAHEIAVNFDNHRSKPLKEQKAIEMIIAVFLCVKINPILNDLRQTSNVQDLVSNLDDFYFAGWLKRAYLSPWDELFDVICESCHIKRGFSAYHKLVKSLKILSLYSDYKKQLAILAIKMEK